jgi:hypothetical protein
LNETLFTPLPKARLALELANWRCDCNNIRSHSGIGWLAPAVYAAKCKREADTLASELE